MYIGIPQIFFFEIPQCKKKVIFLTEVNLILPKRLCTWRNFKNIFSRPLFTIIFKSKKVILATYTFHFEYVNGV